MVDVLILFPSCSRYGYQVSTLQKSLFIQMKTNTLIVRLCATFLPHKVC